MTSSRNVKRNFPCSFAIFACLIIATFTAYPQNAYAQSKAPDQSLNIRFSWKLKGEYAPFYVAREEGFFRQQGLDIALGEGSGAQSTLAAVETGRDTATYAPAIYGIQAISKGLGVKIIALYQPVIPMVIISHPDNPVRTPKELEGKKLGVAVGDTFGDFLPVFCNVNSIHCGKIDRVTVNINAMIPTFVAKQTDATSAYLTNDVPIMRAKGIEFVVLDVRDYNLTVPGGSIIVSDKTIADRPQQLQKMLKALAVGYEFSRKHPLEAARIIKKYWTASLSDDVVAEQITQATAAAPVRADKPFGWIDEAVLAKGIEQMHAAGQLPAPRKPADYFTNALLAQ
jgi:NitT/TauT family transport system substrate-binding protein